MTRTIIQFRLFDEPELIATIEDPSLSVQASHLIQECHGHTSYEQEKILRLSREWIRQEVSRFFGFHFQTMAYDYTQLINKINKYNNELRRV